MLILGTLMSVIGLTIFAYGMTKYAVRHEWVLIIAVFLLSFGVTLAALALNNEHMKSRAAFLADCAKDRALYQCEIMWNLANPRPQHN